MKSKILFFIIILLAPLSMAAQESINEMRKRVDRLSQQITEKEKLLIASEEDVKSKMQNLKIIQGQIADRKEIIALINKEIELCNKEIARLDAEVEVCEERVEVVREEYARSLRGAQKYNSPSGSFAFVFSVNDMGVMMRRYRYIREYASAHQKVANKLKVEYNILKEKRAEVLENRKAKEALLADQVAQQKELQALADKQQLYIDELRGDRKKVEAELRKWRKELNMRNEEIKRAVELEIARKEEERKRMEREEAKKKATAESSKSNKATASGGSSKVAPSTPNVGVGNMSGNFADNKGKIPVPITGPYQIINDYGSHKAVDVGNVKMNFKGLVIAGKKGAHVRCVFPGKVTAVVRKNDLAFVIVRHDDNNPNSDDYLTVYDRVCNIQVTVGQEVKTGDIIADLFTDSSGVTSMIFQLFKERQLVNPLPWLKR